METEVKRRFVPPLGWPPRFHVVLCRAAERPKRVFLNHYPRQVIGFGVRLPKDNYHPGHPYLSFLWARPARWWAS